ncbi:MAG: ABC transporter substrate-binding protein [bacterium]
MSEDKKGFFPKSKTRKINSLKYPNFKQWTKIPKLLSKKEKLLLGVFGALILLSCVALHTVNFYKTANKIPAEGGEYTEGALGQPQFINPILAIQNEIDTDLTELVFSGLFKYTENREIIPDIVESWEISEDKKTYSLKIRNNLLWHDEEKLTSQDILFTFQTITDPLYSSPLKESLESAECQIENDLELKFILKEPYAPFLYNLTFKILPQHIWKDIPPSSFRLASGNLKPIGSGPYKFENLSKDKDGFIHWISLKKWENYYGKIPLISTATFKFFKDQESLFKAYNKKEILGISKLPFDYSSSIQNPESAQIFEVKPFQYFAVFFNNSNNWLKDKNIRLSLVKAINKDTLISQVFSSEAEKLAGLPCCNATEYESLSFSTEEAGEILNAAGFIDQDQDGIKEKTIGSETKKLELSFITADQDWLIKSAEILKSEWEQLGFKINLEIKNLAQLQNETLKNRQFDLFLFGQSLGAEPDPYAFWHSSQKDFPGLNLSMFSSPEADKILESLRTTYDPFEKNNLCLQLRDILNSEIPALFLFNPKRKFLINKKIKNVAFGEFRLPQARFANISSWYIKTKYER